MDPEGGEQPIHDGSGGRCIIASGESYNFPALPTLLDARYSGGLDSSVIAALARRQLGSLHTFRRRWPEFPRAVQELPRQPLDERRVTTILI